MPLGFTPKNYGKSLASNAWENLHYETLNGDMILDILHFFKNQHSSMEVAPPLFPPTPVLAKA